MANRRKPVKSCIKVTGRFDAEAFDPATGKVLWRERFYNAATLAGMTAMLQDFFNLGTQKPNWYAGLIDNVGFDEVSQDDTSASHPGWAEATGYASATRPAWSPLAIASGIATNSSQVTYTATSAMQLKGCFIASSSTKNSAVDVIWATALFSTVRTLAIGNGFRLTYTVVMTGGNA
jgi:hypothetical protein